jgi:hypothetical protein
MDSAAFKVRIRRVYISIDMHHLCVMLEISSNPPHPNTTATNPTTHIHTQEEVLFVLRDILVGATIALVVFSLVGLISALARWCCRWRGEGQEGQGALLREPLLLLEEEENVMAIPPDRGLPVAAMNGVRS